MEDITPSGVRVYGQSETSVAATGLYVVEAWNDSTGFFSPCPSPAFKEELTGYGFSSNGGKSFVDEGGLPNDCTTGFKLYGDPSVEAWQPAGPYAPGYFYISSLYINGTTGQSDVALNACTASGGGISCGTPTVVATGGPGDFLDKPFLSIDPARGRLYESYTRFGAAGNPANGQIELAVCDISTPTAPVCYPGPSPAPYFVVAPASSCVNQGSYPAVDVATGAVYVAWEFNWISNFGNCQTLPTTNNVAYVPFTCLTLTPISPCATTPYTVAVNIVSMDRALIPGYNRNSDVNGRPSDFPRIAVSDRAGTVSIVWNDARVHPLGDILLESFNLTSLSPVQSVPVRLNTLTGGMNFMPSLRQADDGGELSVGYYKRVKANTTKTDFVAVTDVNPRTTTSQREIRVSTVSTDWLAVSSTIIPNFGDYTDLSVRAASTSPYTGDQLYFAWSDGRLGVPQPFSANAPED